MSDHNTGGSRYAGLDTPVKFGAWLRARFKERGVSVSDVAVDIGVAPGTVYNWLKGRLPRPPRGGEPDKFEDGLLEHAGLALSSSQREHLAEQRLVLVGAAAGVETNAVADWPRRGLPASVATFTGRYVQLDQLNRLLVRKERGNAVVISALSGMGGVGKTALAVHWAHSVEVRRTFPDGALYIDLNGFAESEPVAAHEAQARLLRQLGVKPQAIPLEPDAVDGLYHETLAGRSLLLVLDNARDEPQARPLLPKEPRCLAVVTSRNRMAGLTVSHDATSLNLDALTPRESARLLRRLLGRAAEREPDAVDALAEACAHLPLALRIAAADHRSGPRELSLGDYVAGLADDRLSRLAIGSTDPTTAVTAVLDRSYRNLTPDAQRALRLLACHPGADWDQYAAAALLDTDTTATQLDTHLGETTALLDTLCGHSLLDSTDAATGPRYRMHDLTTEYARAHAGTTDHHREQALQRLWNYYRQFVRQAADRYEKRDYLPVARLPNRQPTPDLPDLPTATRWLDAERANLLTAVTHCAETGQSVVVRDLAATMFRYLELAGFWREGIALHTLEYAHTVPDDRYGALNRLAVMRGRLESPGAGRDLYQQALTLARRTGAASDELSILNNLGVMSDKLGQIEDAIDYYQQAIVVARSVGDGVRLGRILGNLGVVYIRLGKYELATEYCEQALAVARDREVPSIAVFALNNLGNISERQGDLSAAADHFRNGLDLARRIGTRVIERACLTGLGSVNELAGQFETSERHYLEALHLTEQLDDHSGRASVLNHLSRARLGLGRLDDAYGNARESLTLATTTENRSEQACAHDNIAKALAAQGDTETARHHWAEALRIFTDLGTPESAEIKRLLAETPPS